MNVDVLFQDFMAAGSAAPVLCPEDQSLLPSGKIQRFQVTPSEKPVPSFHCSTSTVLSAFGMS